MASLKKLASQTGIYGISSIVGRFLNYLLVPLYTTKFVPSEYGVVTEFYAYIAVLQVLLTYGMETGFFRFSQKNFKIDTVFSTVLTSILSSSTLFLTFVIIFSKSISSAIGYANNTNYVLMFAVILVADAVAAVFFAKLRIRNKAFKFMMFKIVNIAVNIILNLFFILLCPFLLENGVDFIGYIYKPEFGVGYIFLSNLIASCIVLILFVPDFFRISFKFSFSLWKQIIVYSLPLLISGLTGAINEMADRILLIHWTVVPEGLANKSQYVMHQLGIYGANAKLAVIMLMFVQAFKYAAEPFFFSYYKDNKSLKVFADVMKYYVILAFTMFLAVLLNLDIVKYFIHKSYFEGLDVVFPLFLSRFLIGVLFILSFWYKLHDLTRLGIVIIAAGALVTLGLNYIFIPKFGYIAAAWTNFATYFVMTVISFIWSRKYMLVPYNFIRILFYISFALILYFSANYINFSSFILNLIKNNICLVIFIVVAIKLEKISLISTINLLKNRVFKKSKQN